MSEAAARSLFKLMAYKDEYEVARLHTQTGFAERLGEQFEGDFRIFHHLAPPMLSSGRDARGRPLKRAFGPWIRTPFKVLARMKGLRGTAFDPFGYTADRRLERELIAWYEGVIGRALARLSPETHARLCDVLSMPMQIRGYGPVKEKAAAKVRAEVEKALAG
jgi:indolepyruvate ferredoxin oxidoreductase